MQREKESGAWSGFGCSRRVGPHERQLGDREDERPRQIRFSVRQTNEKKEFRRISSSSLLVSVSLLFACVFPLGVRTPPDLTWRCLWGRRRGCQREGLCFSLLVRHYQSVFACS